MRRRPHRNWFTLGGNGNVMREMLVIKSGVRISEMETYTLVVVIGEASSLGMFVICPFGPACPRARPPNEVMLPLP